MCKQHDSWMSLAMQCYFEDTVQVWLLVMSSKQTVQQNFIPNKISYLHCGITPSTIKQDYCSILRHHADSRKGMQFVVQLLQNKGCGIRILSGKKQLVWELKDQVFRQFLLWLFVSFGWFLFSKWFLERNRIALLELVHNFGFSANTRFLAHYLC